MNEQELLLEYRESSSPSAFETLVRRYAGVVYSSARRQVGDAALAEDVTQAVFLLLWQKRGKTGRPELLAGWLLRATWYASRRAMTQKTRREHHEKRAAAMRPESAYRTSEVEWGDYAPDIDAAMAKLRDAERSAVALRYLCGMSLREVGESMHISEEAARKRVDRGMEKLRALLAKKTVAPTLAGLTAAIVTSGAEAAPAAVVSGAIASATGSASTSVIALATSVGKIMTWVKVKAAVIVLAAVGIAGGAGTLAAGGGSPQQASVPAGPAFAVPSPAVPDLPGSEVALYRYSVGVEDPVAKDLKAGRTAAPGGGSYEVYLLDEAWVRQLLLREMDAGNAHVLQGHNPLEVIPDSSKPANIAGSDARFYNSNGSHWGIAASAMFSAGSQIALDQTGNVLLRGSMQFRALSAADPKWRGAGRDLSNATMALNVSIAPGQAAVAIMDLGFVGNAKRSHVVVFVPLRLDKAELPDIAKMDYPETYLRLGISGIRQVSSHWLKWRAAATQPTNPAPGEQWQQELSDGTIIRLAGIARPRRWPLLVWDPDGNPTPFLGSWPDHDPTGGQHSSSEETMLRIEVSSPHPIGYGLNPLANPRNPDGHNGFQQAVWNNEFSSIGVRMGIGEWQSAGTVKEGRTYTVGDTRVRIEKLEVQGGETKVYYHVLDATEQALTFALLSKSGEREWASYCHHAFMNGPGVEVRQGERDSRYSYQARIGVGGTRKGEDVELLWRKAEVADFDNFATQPASLPPFDLARTGSEKSREPTKLTTTRPAESDTPAADMQRMLQAAERGDSAGVELYLTGNSPEQVRALAQFIARSGEMSSHFQQRYGRPISGDLGAMLRHLRRSAEVREYALGDNGKASSGDVEFAKGAAGQWQADVSSGSSELSLAQWTELAGKLDNCLQKLKAGQYTDADEAQSDLDQAVRSALRPSGR